MAVTLPCFCYFTPIRQFCKRKNNEFGKIPKKIPTSAATTPNGFERFHRKRRLGTTIRQWIRAIFLEATAIRPQAQERTGQRHIAPVSPHSARIHSRHHHSSAPLGAAAAAPGDAAHQTSARKVKGGRLLVHLCRSRV